MTTNHFEGQFGTWTLGGYVDTLGVPHVTVQFDPSSGGCAVSVDLISDDARTLSGMLNDQATEAEAEVAA